MISMLYYLSKWRMNQNKERILKIVSFHNIQDHIKLHIREDLINGEMYYIVIQPIFKCNHN